MNASPNSFQNFNSLSLNYLKFVTPKIWVLQLSNSNVQVDTNQTSTSGSHDNVQDQVANTSCQHNG
jgi:hypothetical protein